MSTRNTVNNSGCTIDAPPTDLCVQCQVTFTIREDMESPVYVYYELQKFYQNRRSYVKSRSYDQLAGGVSLGRSLAMPRAADASSWPYLYDEAIVNLMSWNERRCERSLQFVCPRLQQDDSLMFSQPSTTRSSGKLATIRFPFSCR